MTLVNDTKEEEQILLTNTDNIDEDSSDVIQNDYYDDDEYDDDDDDSSSWVRDLRSSWQQHAVAILVAIIAATATFLHLKPVELIVSLEDILTHRHAHLDRYERMANVTFCTDRLADITSLHSMEPLHVNFPRDMVTTLMYHYRADMLQDDNYTKVLTDEGDIPNEEFHCLREHAETHQMTTSSTWVYQTPSIKEIVDDPDAIPASLSFTGFAAKFFNLSPKPILLHWDGSGGREDSSRLVAEIPPMEAVGTATTPGQGFYVSPVYDGSHALQRWTVTSDVATLVYENTDKMELWSEQLKLKFQLQKLNLLYARDYLVVAKKTWLAQFPRPPPLHHMWDARTLGQVHTVSSDASHHFSMEERKNTSLSLTLTTTSVAPRVMEIENFLSAFECQHLMQLASAQGLKSSTVVSGSGPSKTDTKTRSSTNAWLDRETDAIVDVIYRRAADVFNIDEALLRHRSNHHDKHASHSSLAESIQVIRYSRLQEYTPHHDFTYPSIGNRYQPSRFATLLLYLNTVQKGGETTFPRAINNQNHDGLSVHPVMGKAVLFYNILPDGNLDDLSQHGSNPVQKGEKWVANMWLWDPVID